MGRCLRPCGSARAGAARFAKRLAELACFFGREAARFIPLKLKLEDRACPIKNAAGSLRGASMPVRRSPRYIASKQHPLLRCRLENEGVGERLEHQVRRCLAGVRSGYFVPSRFSPSGAAKVRSAVDDAALSLCPADAPVDHLSRRAVGD